MREVRSGFGVWALSGRLQEGHTQDPGVARSGAHRARLKRRQELKSERAIRRAGMMRREALIPAGHLQVQLEEAETEQGMVLLRASDTLQNSG